MHFQSLSFYKIDQTRQNQQKYLEQPFIIFNQKTIIIEKEEMISLYLFLSILISQIQTMNVSYDSMFPNIIINSNFSLGHPWSNADTYKLINNSIPGWTCTKMCQIDDCFYLNRNRVRANGIFANCSGRVIDLNSIKFDETVTQQIKVQAGIYRLGFNYYFPYINSNSKILHVQVNENEVLTVYPSVSMQFSRNIVEIDVQLGESVANISFFNTGYKDDSNGFKINNVSLRKYYNSILLQMINATMNNPVLNFICSVPGYRVIFGQLISYFVNLDRLELYSYSNRTYSLHWKMFFNTIYNLKQQGNFLQSYLAATGVEVVVQNWINGLSYKQNDNYLSNLLQKQININSLLQANNTFFGLSLPLFCFQVLLLYVLFRLLFRYPISLFFRSFSFVVPMVTLMFTQGNVERVTFFMFGQILTLFTANYAHKIINVFLILFFFFIVFLVFGIDLLFLSSYKKHWKYLYQAYPNIIWGSVGRFIDKGIFCMLSGAIHRLLINSQSQLLVISILQVFWIIFRCSLLHFNAYKQKIITLLDILSGIIRLCFILSTYFYKISPAAIQILLNQKCDAILILITLTISMTYFLISLTNILQSTSRIIKRINKDNQKQQFLQKSQNCSSNGQISMKKKSFLINYKIKSFRNQAKTYKIPKFLQQVVK